MKPDILIDPVELEIVTDFIEETLSKMDYFDSLDMYAPTDEFNIKLDPARYTALKEISKRLKP